MSDKITVEITKSEWEAIQSRRARNTYNRGYVRGLWDAFNIMDNKNMSMSENKAEVIEILNKLENSHAVDE